METFNLQEFITERNIELQEFIKEQMRVHQLGNLSIDQRDDRHSRNKYNTND